MKKSILLFLGLAIGFFTDAQLQTPALSPSATIKQTVGLTNFEINYSRPSLRGRALYGGIIEQGKLWRFGANKNTTISFDTEVFIEGRKVEKGEYAIFAIPSEREWAIFFYSDTENWGTPAKFEDSKIVAKIGAKIERTATPVETFTIAFDNVQDHSNVNLSVSWGEMMIHIPIKLPTAELVKMSIDNTMNGKKVTEGEYFRVASYYNANRIELEDALKYIDKAIELNKKAPTYYYLTKAEIAQKLGKKEVALDAAKKSKSIAEDSKNMEYIRKSSKIIDELSR